MTLDGCWAAHLGGLQWHTHLLQRVSATWGLTPHSWSIPDPRCSQSDLFCGTINSEDLCASGSGRRAWFHFQHSFFAFLPTFTLMITDVDSAGVARETAQAWLCSQADVCEPLADSLTRLLTTNGLMRGGRQLILDNILKLQTQLYIYNPGGGLLLWQS